MMEYNTGNLVNNSDLTPSERRERASKAGKASVTARRKRKTLKEELLLMLKTGDTQESITIALIEKAMQGDTKAFEVIRDTIGEKPTDKVEMDGGVRFVFDGMRDADEISG